MRDNQLKAVLLSHYGSESAYLDKVKIINDSSERTLRMLDNNGESIAGKVITMVFQDEADPYVDVGWTDMDPYPEGYWLDTDLQALRTKLSNYPENYYKGVVFQVATMGTDGEPYAETRALFKALENGTGVYTTGRNLVDKPEITWQYDIEAGEGDVNVNYYAELYKNKIVEALNRLGFNL